MQNAYFNRTSYISFRIPLHPNMLIESECDTVISQTLPRGKYSRCCNAYCKFCTNNLKSANLTQPPKPSGARNAIILNLKNMLTLAASGSSPCILINIDMHRRQVGSLTVHSTKAAINLKSANKPYKIISHLKFFKVAKKQSKLSCSELGVSRSACSQEVGDPPVGSYTP